MSSATNNNSESNKPELERDTPSSTETNDSNNPLGVRPETEGARERYRDYDFLKELEQDRVTNPQAASTSDTSAGDGGRVPNKPWSAEETANEPRSSKPAPAPEMQQDSPTNALDKFLARRKQPTEEDGDKAAKLIRTPSTIKFFILFFIAGVADLIALILDLFALVPVTEVINVIMNILWLFCGISTLIHIIRMEFAYRKIQKTIEFVQQETQRYATLYETYTGQKIKKLFVSKLAHNAFGMIKKFIVGWIIGFLANLLSLPANLFEASVLYRREWEVYHKMMELKSEYLAARKEEGRIKQAAIQAVISFEEQQVLAAESGQAST